MKKILIFAIVFVFSTVLINCSTDSGIKQEPPANSNTATGSAPAQPAPARDGNTGGNRMDDGKSDADRADDGKSDADKSNSNQ